MTNLVLDIGKKMSPPPQQIKLFPENSFSAVSFNTVALLYLSK